MRKVRTALCFLASALAAVAQPRQYGYQVVHIYPHDRSAFTQGLEFRAGFLYEGTGLNGRSMLRKVKLETGEAVQQINLSPDYFGEGITVINQQIIELTWRTQIGFVYDQNSFRRLRSFSYSGEGWGLTNDGSQIYMSDGTPEIRVWDPVTLQEKRRFTVRDGAAPVTYLNELEWVRGEIYATFGRPTAWSAYRLPMAGYSAGWICRASWMPPIAPRKWMF